MSCGIYKITNNINNKIYIGQSINIEQRWKKEIYKAFNKNDNSYNTSLSSALRKYGINNFTFEIIEECSCEELNDKEIFYISQFNSYYEGYNETTGGQGNSNNCLKISKNDLLKIYDLLINTDIPQKDIATQFSVGEDVISNINNGKTRLLQNHNYPLRKKGNFCCECGVQISSKAIKCSKCEKESQRKVTRPSRKELKQLIRTNSFLSLGKKYGVSDNAIRKWCLFYNLPNRKKDINSYSDNEWDLI